MLKIVISEVPEVTEVFYLPNKKGKDNETGDDSLPSSSSSSPIYRLGHSDTYACHNCKQKGDKWFMQKHWCKGANDKVSL